MNTELRNTLHHTDSQFLDGFRTIDTTMSELQKSVIHLMEPHENRNRMAESIFIFKELGNTSLRSYIKVKTECFDRIMNFVSSLDFTTGAVPSYITHELTTPETVNWLIRHGLLYKKYNFLSFFDILCITYVFSNPLRFRMSQSIVESSKEYIAEILQSITNELLVSFRNFYRNCGYWQCLIESTSALFKPDATSIADYTEEEQSYRNTVLENNMNFYVECLHQCFSFEKEIFDWLVESKLLMMNRALSKKIAERIQLVNIIHQTIRIMMQPSIFTQQIEWMCSKWISTSNLDDPYLTDISTQIKAITNFFKHVHVYNHSHIRYGAIRSDASSHILQDAENIQYIVPCKQRYDTFVLNRELLSFIMNATGPIHIFMRVQFMTSIPDETWIYMIRGMSQNREFIDTFYTDLLRNYILIEGFNEHNGFQQQVEFRDSILKVLSAHQWLRGIFTNSPKMGFEFIVLISSHALKLVELCNIDVYEMRFYMSRVPQETTKIELARLYMEFEDRMEALHTLIICMTHLMTYRAEDMNDYGRWWYSGIIDFLVSFTRSINHVVRASVWYDRRLLRFRQYKELILDMTDTIYLALESFWRCTEANPSSIIHHSDNSEWFKHLRSYITYNNTLYVESEQDVSGFHIDTTSIIHDTIGEIVDELDGFIQRHHNEYTESMPSEFCDPILFNDMEHPMELPDMKILVDEWSIMKHVVVEKNNPYTRKSLNIDELFEYQKSEDVVERIREYKERLAKWKEEHRK